jgi:hypothetical protein
MCYEHAFKRSSILKETGWELVNHKYVLTSEGLAYSTTRIENKN